MTKRRLILLAFLLYFAVGGSILSTRAGDKDAVGFINSIEYANFNVKLGIFDLSNLPAELMDSLEDSGLAKYVALVIVMPTSRATDSSNDHSWLIVDADGIEYRSIDPFLREELAEKIDVLEERTKRMIFRSSPRHAFAPNRANPLLIFFSEELPPIDRWSRVVFLDYLNHFQVDMQKISMDELEMQLLKGMKLI